MFADQMIGHKLITKQTGARGRLCNAVYICERKFARREFYLAILMDRASQSPVIVASSQGGMDIETVAKETPDAIITTRVDIKTGVTDDMARNIATELGFSEQCVEEAKDTIQKLYKLFIDKDATQIEINPLSETSDHQVLNTTRLIAPTSLLPPRTPPQPPRPSNRREACHLRRHGPRFRPLPPKPLRASRCKPPTN